MFPLSHYRLYVALIAILFFPGLSVSAQDPAALGPELVPASGGHGMMLSHARESFSTLSLKDSDLHAQPPLLGSRERTKTYIRELWQVRWRPNDPLDLYVILPIGAKNPPIVLYLYGFPSETDRFKNDGYCQRVVKGGAAAIGFVSALTGHRAEHRPPTQWFISELQESLATSVHDVQMILNYLDSRGDLDTSRVGMFGQGSGGTIAILAASADSRLKALDLLDPWGDWPDWLAETGMIPEQLRAAYSKPDFLKRLEPLEPVRCLPDLRSRSMRIQFVDEYGESKETVRKIETAAPPKSKIIHYPTALAFRSATLDGGLFAWIATELKSREGSITESSEATAETKFRP